MTPITKGTPRAYLLGIQDLSRRTISPQPEQIPQHLPLVPLLTERGPTEPQIVAGSFSDVFGASSLDEQSVFFTHQTALAKLVMAQGNYIMVQRVKPNAAKTSMLRLSVELIPCNIPVYERNPDGSIRYAALVPGQTPVPIVDETIQGTRVIWHIGTTNDLYPTNAEKTFGGGTVRNAFRAGDFIPDGGADNLATLGDSGDEIFPNSTLYPVADFEVSNFGDYGNRVGLRLIAPTTRDTLSADVDTINTIKAYVYRFACVERSVKTQTPIITPTKNDELYLDTTFKQNVTNPRTGRAMGIADTFIDAWEEEERPGFNRVQGPFGRVHIYHNELDTVLNMLAQGYTYDHDGDDYTIVGEGEYDILAEDFGRDLSQAFTGRPENNHLLNAFTGFDVTRTPYFSFEVERSVYFGGVSLRDEAVHYADGGSDGLTLDFNNRPDILANHVIYDGLVSDMMSNFGNGEVKYLDDAKYPLSTIWDTGFSRDTKDTLLIPMSLRKDVWVALSTFSVIEPIPGFVGLGHGHRFTPRPSLSDEIGTAISLRSTAANYPESVVYGTGVCRAIIVGHNGKLIGSNWSTYLPLTLDIAEKVADYLGASDGRWKAGAKFDASPANQVELFRDLSHTWRSDNNKDRSWDAGLIYVENYNTKSKFYPAFQTVYTDDTSVLNSFLTMLACCELEKVAQRVWRDLSGDTSLTRDQFIERSNALIIERVRGRFDNRYVIEPETFFTAADSERGYSWSCRINIYASGMKTVGSYTIVARDQSELTA